MAGSLNKVMLIGRLGADPEIRRTQDGRPVATFSLATSERWRDKATGEKRERTEWHHIVVFNEGLCEVVEKYLKKGKLVFIEGALGTRKWTDQAKIERWTTEVVLKAFRGEVQMLESAERMPGAGSADDYGSEKAAPAPGASDKPDLDDEIPF
jgi:single-strand DNA-binding protein